MAATSTRVKVTYVTNQKLEFSVTFHVAPGIVDPNNMAIQAIITAINRITAAWPIRIEISAVNPLSHTAGTGVAFVNEDKVFLVFRDNEQNAHTLKLPGIVATALNADGETLDCTTSDGLTLVTDISAVAISGGGGALQAPTYGLRRAARKSLKK